MADYAAVKCAAAYDTYTWTGGILRPGQTGDTLEVAVCYQIRNSEAPDNSDWDIGITVMQWYGSNLTNWWQNQPDTRTDVVLPDQLDYPKTAIDQFDDLTPAITYDYATGDIYVVYTNVQEDPHAGTHNTIAWLSYRRYCRQANTISNEQYAQSTTHNGFEPSIDVGLIYNGQPWLAVAYTSQFRQTPGDTDPHTGYHVCVSAIPTSSFPVNYNPPVLPQLWTLLDVRNRNDTNQYYWLDAGQPSLNISDGGGVVAYTQVTGSDDFGPITRVYTASLSGILYNPNYQHQIVLPVDLNPPTGETLDDDMYPSIAFDGGTNNGNPTLSVTFMGQEAQTATLHPFAAHLEMNSSTGALSVLWHDKAASDNPTITGNFNMSDIPFICPGISTAIIPTGTGWYWAAWCDRTEMEPPPEEVSASYGYAG